MKVVSLGPPNPDNLPEDGKLKSEVMVKDNRRYYLDLKENSRGRFLRVIYCSILNYVCIQTRVGKTTILLQQITITYYYIRNEGNSNYSYFL